MAAKYSKEGLDYLLREVGGYPQTPSGLRVPPGSFDALVKAEARRIAKQDRSVPALFSRYSMAQNMVAYGAREKPSGTPSFDALYAAAEKSVVDAIIIQARIDQNKLIWQRALHGKQIGFKVVHDRHDDPDFVETDDIKRRCRELEELIGDPTPEKYSSWFPHNLRIHTGVKDLMSRLVRTELIIDRKALYLYKKRNGKGVAAFHWLPGESLRPVHEGVQEWARRHEPSGQVTGHTLEKIYSATGFDLTNAAHVQLVDGQITGAFSSDEVSIHIANPSDRLNRWGYGTSRLEMSLDVTASLVYAWSYNRQLFDSDFPEQVLSITGQDVDREGLDAFKQEIIAAAGGPDKKQRMPVIPGGDDAFKIESIKLRDTPKDMLFDQFFRMMVALKCASFGTHPSTINFSMDSPNGGSMFGHNPSDEIEFSKEHGLRPALMDMCDWLTRSVVKPQYDDLRLILVGIDEEDEKAALDLQLDKVKTFKTRNQALIEDGGEPQGDPDDPNNPWNYPADAPVATYISAIQQKQAMEQGMGEEGMEGEDPQAMDPEAQPEEEEAVEAGLEELPPEPEPVAKSRKEKFFEIVWED